MTDYANAGQGDVLTLETYPHCRIRWQRVVGNETRERFVPIENVDFYEEH